MTQLCTVPECSRLRTYRATCKAHYNRLRETGTIGSSSIRPRGLLDRTCSVPQCERRPVAKNLCASHYRRASLYGSPLGAPEQRSALDRFFDHVEVTEACWQWTGMKRKGYGRFSFPTRTQYVSAHRWLFEIVVFAVPDGLELDHLCRTRACVNPDHLEAVTHSVNLERAQSHRTSHSGATTSEPTEG